LNCDFCHNDVSQFHDLCPPGEPWPGFPQSPTTCATSGAPDFLHNHKTNSIKEGLLDRDPRRNAASCIQLTDDAAGRQHRPAR
jgi:hypothetical protein